ncbi:MAG TPA: glycosyltransferase [Vicinamibacteria bacterium]|nr:glycosyltransferase [Vicinamibacteria bacterium]
MRVLLMTSTEKGHLNPMVGVAQHLMRAGHHVGWLSFPEPSEQLTRLGVEVLALDGQPTPPAHITGGEALARLVLDPEALRLWIRGLLIEAVPEQVDPVRAVIRSFRPLVVATDGMLYQGVIAASLEGVPWAGVSTALTLLEPPDLDFALIRNVRSLAAERSALFLRYGLKPSFRTCECLSPLLNVIFATPDFVGSDASIPPATQLVGPSTPLGERGDEPPFPWDRLDDRRALVYVSFGSQIYWQPDLFSLIAEAASFLDVQVVMNAGDLAQGGFPATLPGDAVAVRYAPQIALLKRAAVLVSHGGANSVMEAMTHGVPLLLLPICNDQPVQAYFLAKAGAGRSLDRQGLTVAALREALQALMTEGPERANARRVQAAYRRHDGAARAAELIAGIAG